MVVCSYFCRFEQTSCSFRGSYNAVFMIDGIHDMNSKFMFKRTGDQICAFVNGAQRGCYSQKQAGPMYGAIQNDGGSSRNLHQCYWKVGSSTSDKDGKVQYNSESTTAKPSGCSSKTCLFETCDDHILNTVKDGRRLITCHELESDGCDCSGCVW